MFNDPHANAHALFRVAKQTHDIPDASKMWRPRVHGVQLKAFKCMRLPETEVSSSILEAMGASAARMRLEIFTRHAYFAWPYHVTAWSCEGAQATIANVPAMAGSVLPGRSSCQAQALTACRIPHPVFRGRIFRPTNSIP